ncbi:uncharacterized protein LOC126549906 [Aphis gossypii]|uniref:uncharacterized protein LOC126549906 n=1 Tax=Aphis gossypii TaxID=80765 RepID=UPI002159A47C|nr:uncharacterized protein LOC126549906 [Aphis gossypii]
MAFRSWDIPFFHIPRNNPEDYLEMMKSLFYLSAQDKDMQVIDCFVVYVNICRGSFLNLDEEIKRAIRSVGFTVTDYNEEETDNWINAWDETMFDNEEYTELEIDHAIIQASIGIYWNFITKRLTNANIEGWLRKRRSAYAKTCGISEENEALISLSPELNFADKVNQSMTACFAFKTTIFRAVQALSTRPSHRLHITSKFNIVDVASMQQLLDHRLKKEFYDLDYLILQYFEIFTCY